MGKQKQVILTHSCDNLSGRDCDSLSGWDRAICEAERQIETAQEKIKRLRLSIETFKEMRAKGEPFPGSDKEHKETAA